MVLLVLFATAASYMLVSSLNRGSVAMSLTRAEKNRAVMKQAKDALIAYAASETLQGGAASFRPGRLPCPDRTNVDGSAASSCAGVNLLGRLPYKTLGIEELRDASGERLWYAVSNNFKTGAGVINADTRGAITVSGLAPATNAVAVVFSPGAVLGSQDRSAAGMNTATNYLEGINSDTNYDKYIAENVNDPVVTNLFNDQLLVITEQDLFSAIGPVVAARIQRDIALLWIYNPSPGTSTSWTDGGGTDKSRYFDAWGRFPFAAPFANPGSSSFTGVTGTREGLLPMVSTNYYWTGGSGNVTQTSSWWTGSISSVNCSTPGSPNTILRCAITWSNAFYGTQLSFRMSGTVAGVGLGLVQLPKVTDVTRYTGTCCIDSRSLSGSVNSSGVGTVILNATVPWSSWGASTTVDIANPVNSPVISSGDPDAGWFSSDQWYKQTYYAVSAGYAPGGSGSCTPGTNCLTVNNLNATTTNDKRAILIFAGRSLANTSRPNATPGDYLESQNASTGDRIFEHGLRSTSTTGVAINDKAIVIAP